MPSAIKAPPARWSTYHQRQLHTDAQEQAEERQRQVLSQCQTQDTEKLIQHLERLWEHFGIPWWHQKLYTERCYSDDVQPEVILQEAEALAAGTSVVQQVQQAIKDREDVLIFLSVLRGAFDDHEFCTPGSVARRQLSDYLYHLRIITMTVISKLTEWRRAVGPRGQKGAAVVAGPSGRGAIWPCQIDGGKVWEDYLLYTAKDDSIVRSFKAVVELCDESDPLLLHGSVGGVGPHESGLLCPPSCDALQERGQLEEARLQLLELEMSLKAFAPHSSRTSESYSIKGGSPVRQKPSFRASSRLLAQLTAPLELPPLKTRAGTERTGRHDGHQKKGQLPQRPRSGVERPSRPLSGAALVSRPKSESFVYSPPQSHVSDPGHLEHSNGRQEAESQTNRAKITPSSNNSAHNDVGYTSVKSSTKSRGHNSLERTFGRLSDKSAPLELSRGIPILKTRASLGADPDARFLVDMKPASGEEHLDGDKGEVAVEGEDSVPQAAPANNQIDDARVQSAWNRFESDMTIHHDDIPMALQRVGFPQPNKEWLEDAFQEVTMFNGVNKEEFRLVVDNYDRRQRVAFSEEFKLFDSDGSGQIDIEEFAILLQSLGVEPMQHVLEECIDEIDDDQTGTLGFDEFYAVMSLLAQREGFTNKEYKHLEEVFKKFTKSGGEDIEVKDFYSMVLYMGVPASTKEAKDVAGQVDLDRGGAIDFQEFVMCMRIFRDQELQSLKKELAMHDYEGSGYIAIDHLPQILQRGGYFADEEVVIEVLTEIGMDVTDPEDTKLDLSGLWQFLVLFRKREGLSKHDADGVKEAFQRFCHTSEGHEPEVSTSDLPKILRSIGYSMSLEEQKHITAQVDIDRSGALSFSELLKLIRLARESRFRSTQEAFHRADEPSVGRIRVDVALATLASLGCVRQGLDFPPPILAAELEMGMIELIPFMRVAKRLDDMQRLAYKDSGGYSSFELEKMKARFDFFDSDGSGDVGHQELISLIMELFPGMATDPKKRPELMAIMREADDDGSGNLNFDEFLKLMRKVEDMGTSAQLSKERHVILDTGFSVLEVSEFRAIFLDRSKGEPILPLKCVKEMLNPLCPMGDKNSEELNRLWYELVVAPKEGKVNKSLEKQADFPEFLLLMRRLLTDNFGGLAERMAKSAT